MTSPASAAAAASGPADPDNVGGAAVALVTLGCARNDVDSEELAARLERGGYRLVDEPVEADAVVVNTCGFVETAKKDSVDTLLAAAELPPAEGGRQRKVVAVGCMAERYGRELATALPEADAVLGFDDYPDIAARVGSVLAGDEQPAAHRPADRRRLLPLTPVQRADHASVVVPGHTAGAAEPDLPVGIGPSSGPRAVRRRLGSGPMAPIKLASGCDRRCSFCAIPAFRGAFVSRRPSEVLDDARWLAQEGVRELFLVSENTTSYGKDLGDLRLLETLLPEIAEVDGIDRVRVSYLQPAEMRPGLLDALTSTPGVAPYFDLSFQHASGPVLRRMRRFGDSDRFLALLEEVRRRAPLAGVRSNVIVGFPGETEADLDVLCDFLSAARLDVTGVFGYSDEDGTEAETLDGHLDSDEVRARAEHVSALVEELVTQRAEERVGEQVSVLVESVTAGVVEGRAAHQGPDVDGNTTLGVAGHPFSGGVQPQVGDLLAAVVVASEGADLIAQVAAP